MPVSAQKGLVAKVTGDDALLQASQLPALELALGEGMLGQRQKILQAAVAAGIGELQTEAGRVLHIRRRDLAEQMLELRGLQGKNVSVIKQMRTRIEQEQAEFDGSGAKIQAVRSVHLKLLRDVVNLLSAPTLKVEMAELTTALKQPGIKLRREKDLWRHLFAVARRAAQGAGARRAKSSPCWTHPSGRSMPNSAFRCRRRHAPD